MKRYLRSKVKMKISWPLKAQELPLNVAFDAQKLHQKTCAPHSCLLYEHQTRLWLNNKISKKDTWLLTCATQAQHGTSGARRKFKSQKIAKTAQQVPLSPPPLRPPPLRPSSMSVHQNQVNSISNGTSWKFYTRDNNVNILSAISYDPSVFTLKLVCASQPARFAPAYMGKVAVNSVVKF